MSHQRPPCTEPHTFGAWTTVERENEAGERQFVFQRSCTLCPHVDEERGAIIDDADRSPPTYAKTQEAGSEPDD